MDEQSFHNIIFLNLDMPGIGGLDFAELYCQKYAEKFPQTKLVILSCYFNRRDREHVKQKPCVAAFLQKPLSKDMVQQLLIF